MVFVWTDLTILSEFSLTSIVVKSPTCQLGLNSLHFSGLCIGAVVFLCTVFVSSIIVIHLCAIFSQGKH